MKNVVHPWKLSLSHPHASVLIEQTPLLKPIALDLSVSNAHKINASIVTDHPLLNELIQIGIAVLPVLLPFVVGLLGDPSEQSPTLH